MCHFKGVGSILSLLFNFLWKIQLANNVDPDQTPQYVASDLGLHCLPMTFLHVFVKGFSSKDMLIQDLAVKCMMNLNAFTGINKLDLSTYLYYIVLCFILQCPPRDGGQGGEMSLAPGNASSARN